MKKVKYNVYALIIGVCLSSNNVIAQEEGGFMLEEVAEAPPPVYYSNVEFGFIYNSEDSFKFGEYNGLEEEGFYADFNFNVDLLTPYDDDSTQYAEFYGTDVGLDSRSVYGEYGQQGRYSAYVEYDQLPHFRLDDARTPFIGAGTNNQTLPAGWVFGDDPIDTSLQRDARQVDVETERKKAGGGFTWIPLENWQVRGNYHHEIKDGNETLAAIFGSSGGNMESSILIVPVDYEFDEFDTGVSYIREQYQLDLSYHFSSFNNRDARVNWRNPSTLGGAAGPNDPGQIESSGPDNTAHQVTLSGGYNFGLYNSRLSGSFSFGQMLQDDNFSPYGVNPAFPVLFPLPRSSLDGEIQTIFANLNYTARPLPRLSVGAHYTYDDRDNQTPRDVYSRIRNDSAAQFNPNVPGDTNRLPRPYSLERHLIELDGDYRLTRMAKLGVGYEFESIDRDFSEVDTTDEHTGKVKLSMTPFSMTSGWVEYAYSKRDGDDYVSNQPFLDGHPPDHIAFVTATDPDDLFENNPFLRKSYLADRNKHEVRGTVNYVPYNQMSLGLTGGYADSSYDDTRIGLRGETRLHSTLDFGIYPTEDVDGYAFLTYERLTHSQVGWERGNVPVVPGDILDLDDFWAVGTEDQIYSLGTGIKVRDIMGRIDISADYTFSFADTKTDTDGNAGLGPPFAELPHIKTKIHSFNITGDYRLRENMKLRAAYLFEYYRSRDFSLDDVTLATDIDDVMLLGNSSPNYTAHVGWLSFIYEF